jgi:hypothetical protein
LNSFFDTMDHLEEVELLRMSAAWRSVARSTHEEAWAAVRTVGARYGISKEIDWVRKRAMAWASRGNNSIPYMIDNNETWAAAKLQAEEAIVDIALGIALGDRLDDQTRVTLLAASDRAT